MTLKQKREIVRRFKRGCGFVALQQEFIKQGYFNWIQEYEQVIRDFLNGKFNMFLPNDCDRAPVYWTRPPFAAVPMRRASDRNFKTIVTVSLDGERLEAELDTGSTSSFLSLQTARRGHAGRNPAAEGRERAVGG